MTPVFRARGNGWKPLMKRRKRARAHFLTVAPASNGEGPRFRAAPHLLLVHVRIPRLGALTRPRGAISDGKDRAR
jgi:hypothetical protein